MCLHTWCCQGPCKPNSCATFTFNSHWGRAATGKKSLVPICTGRFSSVQLIVTLWTVACQASLSGKGVLQARILEHIGQYWLPYPSRALAALVASSPEYLVLPEPLLLKQLHHLHTWPSQGQTQVLQGSLRSKPQWIMHIQTWK